MEMKVLSGVLVTTSECRDGEAIIDLETNKFAVGPDGTPEAPTGCELARTYSVGLDRSYTSKPCRMLALRQIQIDVFHEGTLRDRYERDYLRIDDKGSSDNKRFMGLVWESTGGSEIQEISYMVIGETD